MRQYLLGGLSSDEMERVEQLLLCDDTFYDEVVALEDELIDRYIGNSLSAQDRASFESHFLTTPERRRQVSFARALKRYAAERPTPRQPFADPRPGPASRFGHLITKNRAIVRAVFAVLLIALVGSTWLTVRNWRAPYPASGPSVATTLSPSAATRSDGRTRRVEVPLGTGTLELHLQLQGTTYDNTYKVVVRGVEDKVVVFTSDQLHPDLSETPATVIVKVLARDMRVGREDYVVSLSGVTPEGSEGPGYNYTFRPTPTP